MPSYADKALVKGWELTGVLNVLLDFRVCNAYKAIFRRYLFE